jgi:uncharacterized membrane protein
MNRNQIITTLVQIFLVSLISSTMATFYSWDTSTGFLQTIAYSSVIPSTIITLVMVIGRSNK